MFVCPNFPVKIQGFKVFKKVDSFIDNIRQPVVHVATELSEIRMRCQRQNLTPPQPFNGPFTHC